MKRFSLAAMILQLVTIGCYGESPQPGYAIASNTRIGVGAAPNSVEVADFNMDGKPDFVVANAGSNNVTILLGDGKGKFVQAKGSPFPAGTSPNDICIADFNGDGKLDLAIANHEAKYLTVLLGDGRGGFKDAPGSPVAVLSRPHTHGVACGDFNNDGKPDLVTDSWGENRVTVVFGNGSGGFSSPGSQFAVGKRPYQRVRVADVNADGNADVITTNLEGDNVTVLLGDGRSGFSEAVGSPFPGGKTPFFVAIGDLNRDKKLDLAIANWTGQGDQLENDGVTILLGDGGGSFKAMQGSPLRAGRAPSRLAIGDVNGDGTPDVVTTNYVGNDITVFLGGKDTLTRTATVAVGGEPDGIAISDLNADGKADIVVANTRDNNISVLLSK
jgi:hypothetical protein